MLSEVMDYFGVSKELDHLGYFETDEHAHLERELKKIIRQGRLVAPTKNSDKVDRPLNPGIVGSER